MRILQRKATKQKLDLEQARRDLVTSLTGEIRAGYMRAYDPRDPARLPLDEWLIQGERLENIISDDDKLGVRLEVVDRWFNRIRTLQTDPDEFEWFTQDLERTLDMNVQVIISFGRTADKEFAPTLVFRRP